MPTSAQKDIDKIIRRARRQGFVVTKTRRHYKIWEPNGRRWVTAPVSCSDIRGPKNLLVNLRGLGFKDRRR